MQPASLSPCQPTSTCQGESELSPESAGNWWCGAHHRWVNFVHVRPNRLRSTQLTFWIENRRCGAASRNSSLQRETHSGEPGRCFPGGSENIWAVGGPAGEVSKTYHRNSRWSSQHGCCRDTQAPWWSRHMGKLTSFRPPHGLLGWSTVTRNNYGRQPLFQYCLQMPLAQCACSQ